jgi:dTDP-4-dehydrorhamnose 3,5-epimerase
MSFVFTPTYLPEVVVVSGKRFGDERGFFSEVFRCFDFSKYFPPFVQENLSRSSPLCLRGLHYQTEPMAQGKLVRCISGSIMDVAVDIRKSSPNFGKWVSVYLDEDDDKWVYVPVGFAHGFCVCGDKDAYVMYKTTEYYSPENDRGIFWNDPDIGIKWTTSFPDVSDKDANAPLLKDAEVFV